uniref:Uncharacterized protein n=1 Tax=Pseudonaja textilis TaxID=8673 RepID=A0A670ZIK8_PSETE
MVEGGLLWHIDFWSVKKIDVRSTGAKSRSRCLKLRGARSPKLESLGRTLLSLLREPACKLSICVTQDLVKRLNQWTDSSKDTSAPPKQLTISGYGRRRRSFVVMVLLVAGSSLLRGDCPSLSSPHGMELAGPSLGREGHLDT